MDLLNGNTDNCSHDRCQNHCIIYGISLSFAVVKGREKFHEKHSHEEGYKTVLPFTENKNLQSDKNSIIDISGMYFRGLV